MFEKLLLKIKLEWYIWKLSGLTSPDHLLITDVDYIKKYDNYTMLLQKIKTLQLFSNGVLK